MVVGVSGGIGRALAEALAARGTHARVWGLSRSRPHDWPEDEAHGWLPVDLLDEASLARAAARLAKDGVVTTVLVATGVLATEGAAPEKTYRALDAAALAVLFAVNATGPALVAKHLLPLTPRDRRSVFAALSARVGSIGDNRLGGWYAYRASKAALNMLMRTLAVEHRQTRPQGVLVVLHPGTVETALSRPFVSRASTRTVFRPAFAAAALLQVLDGLQPEDTGGFFAWDGQPVPW